MKTDPDRPTLTKRILVAGLEHEALQMTALRFQWLGTRDVQTAVVAKQQAEMNTGDIFLTWLRHLGQFERTLSLGTYDLLLVQGCPIAQIDSADEWAGAIESSGSNVRKVLLISSAKEDWNLGLKRSSRFRLTTLQYVVSSEVNFRRLVEELLDITRFAKAPRTQICELYDHGVVRRDIDQILVLTANKLPTAALLENTKKFEAAHVPYEPAYLENFEDEADRVVDPAHRYLDSINVFDKELNADDARMTYLVVGRRGCGKSSFLHYYCRSYDPFRKRHIPYIIVDFLRYGYIEDSSNLHSRILRNLRLYIDAHYTGPLPTELSQKYCDLNPHGYFRSAMWYFEQQRNILFEDVVSNELRREIMLRLGEPGLLKLAESISRRVCENERMAFDACEQCLRERPWEWFRHVWLQINSDQPGKPIRYVADWIAERAFPSTEPAVPYLDGDLIREGLQDWKSVYLSRYLSRRHAMLDSEVVTFVRSFVDACIEKYGRLVLCLDNIDRLASRNSERLLLEALHRAFATQYERLKFVVACRPSSFDLFADKIGLHPERSLFIQDNGEYNTFSRTWLKKVSLRSIVEKRIDVIQAECGGRKYMPTFAKLRSLLSLPVGTSKSKRPVTTLASLIDGFTGTNIRAGLELFSHLISSPYVDMMKRTPESLVWRSKTFRHNFIAEHMLFRALFLSRESPQRLPQSLVNLFHVPGVQGYATTLLSIRILEILRKVRRTSVSEVYDYLFGLGYIKTDIRTAIAHLNAARLTQVTPESDELTEGSQAAISIRHRGTFYLTELSSRISYVELMYFMCFVPAPFSDPVCYPRVPDPTKSELTEIVSRFLQYVQGDLALERANASEEGILHYSKICPLEQIHEELCRVYFELQDIEGP
ncbi:MAG TPA: hypothetical protein VL486_00790 [Verrucomicrobiae bacterium]|nr:hypothetical protein [Verrucomicrobiae bacterium]